MPSSLIFAGLAAAWLVVLVPMVAKRRQEVIRTADSALASRVLRRSAPARGRADHDEEMGVMTEQRFPCDGDELHRRSFRPGRGGFDPEAAALAARARYAARQRVVIGLLVASVASMALAFAVSSTAWWAVGGTVVALVGYLAYLRRQVRIEEEVRRRRAARLGEGDARRAPEVRDENEYDYDGEEHGGEVYDGDETQQDAREEEAAASRAASPPTPHVHPRAVALDLDDEDPAFAELDRAFEPPYRRAVGE
ncbi:MAG: hypothetical protein M3R63_04570 [Actinomycetota bacterium]|nr:hypothetical protein [Actinomycetota bacterium]